jgi:hypothetical protein
VSVDVRPGEPADLATALPLMRTYRQALGECRAASHLLSEEIERQHALIADLQSACRAKQGRISDLELELHIQGGRPH